MLGREVVKKASSASRSLPSFGGVDQRMEPLPAALAVVPVPGFVLVCAGFQPVLQSPDPAISESGIFQLTLGVKWCSDLALLSCAYRCYRFEPQYIFYFPDGLLCGNVS